MAKEDVAIVMPEVWYKSKNILAQIAQAITGIALMTGLISPEQGDILSGAAVSIAGAIATALAAVSLWVTSRSGTVKLTN